jgi:NAD+ kinase
LRIKIVATEDFPEIERLKNEFEVSGKAEICVALGGDGAFVRAAREFDGPILPIRSRRALSSGFYSDLSLDDIDFVVENLKARKYLIEKLENKIEITHKGRKYYAVNEATLRNIHREVNFKVYQVSKGSREEIYPYIMGGDGILITGVTGSTAYNRSAGGPLILSPDVFCLTFLNVDGPYRNPIVVDASKVIEIELSKYNGILDYDGMRIAELKPGDKLAVRLSERELKIVRFEKRKESLANKLERIITSRMVKEL